MYPYFNAELLHRKIVSSNSSQKSLAKKLNISEKTFSSKMTGKNAWTLPEIQRLTMHLKFDSPQEILDIFFPLLPSNFIV